MQKAKRIEIRVSVEDYDAIKTKADQSGRTVSELLRESVARAKSWTIADRATEQDKIRQIAKIGNNLNQIARWCNQSQKPETAQILVYLAAIENALREI